MYVCMYKVRFRGWVTLYIIRNRLHAVSSVPDDRTSEPFRVGNVDICNLTRDSGVKDV